MNTEILSLKKILLVEDDPQDVELTLAALAEHNLANQVAVVRDGAEALDYLYRREKFKNRANGHPILVLLDLKMPKVNGLEVLREIKRHEKLRPMAKGISVFRKKISQEAPSSHGSSMYST